MSDEKVQTVNDAIKEGYIMGLEQALQMAKLHKQYSKDIDYNIATLAEYLEKKKTE